MSPFIMFASRSDGHAVHRYEQILEKWQKSLRTWKLECKETFNSYKYSIVQLISDNRINKTVVQTHSCLQIMPLCATLTWHKPILLVSRHSMFCKCCVMRCITLQFFLHSYLFHVSFVSVCFKCTILNSLHIECHINAFVVDSRSYFCLCISDKKDLRGNLALDAI
jgi:hypothetical protein